MDDRNHGEKDLLDCIYGKKYLQTLDYIDDDRIGIIGGSYGGFMTMAGMTLHPDEFKVGVNIFGSYWVNPPTNETSVMRMVDNHHIVPFGVDVAWRGVGWG